MPQFPLPQVARKAVSESPYLLPAHHPRSIKATEAGNTSHESMLCFKLFSVWSAPVYQLAVQVV